MKIDEVKLQRIFDEVKKEIGFDMNQFKEEIGELELKGEMYGVVKMDILLNLQKAYSMTLDKYVSSLNTRKVKG